MSREQHPPKGYSFKQFSLNNHEQVYRFYISQHSSLTLEQDV